MHKRNSVDVNTAGPSRRRRFGARARQRGLLEAMEPRLLMAAAPTAPLAAGLSRIAYVNTPQTITYNQLLQDSGVSDPDGDAIAMLISRVSHTQGYLYLRRGSTVSPVFANTVYIVKDDALVWYPTTTGIIPAFTIRAADATQHAANETAMYINTQVLPEVRVTTTSLQAWEASPDAGIGRLTISRTGDVTQPLQVAIAHITNNPNNAATGAVSGNNYELLDPAGGRITQGASTVIIPAGQASVDLRVRAINDNNVATALQQVAVVIRPDISATPTYSASPVAWFAGVNIIDAAPVISITAAATSIQEGQPNQPGFLITRTPAPGGTLDGVQTAVQINYNSTASTFPTALHLSAPTVALFGPGETVKGIILNTTSDGVARGTASALTIVASISGSGFAVSGSRTASVTVVDSAPTVSLATAVATADETLATPGQFVITRTGSLAEPLTVNFTVGTAATNSVRGTGYTLAYASGGTINGNSLTIPAGASSVAVNVIPRDDGLNNAATVPMTVVANGTQYNLATTVTGTVTITTIGRTPVVQNLSGTRVGIRNTPIEMSYQSLLEMTAARRADGSRGPMQLRVGALNVGTLSLRLAGATTATAAAAGATINPGDTLIWTPPANTAVNNLVAFTLFAVDGNLVSAAGTSVIIAIL